MGLSGLVVHRKHSFIIAYPHFLCSPVRTPASIFGMTIDLRNLCCLPLLGAEGSLLKAEPEARIYVQAI